MYRFEFTLFIPAQQKDIVSVFSVPVVVLQSIREISEIMIFRNTNFLASNQNFIFVKFAFKVNNNLDDIAFNRRIC